MTDDSKEQQEEDEDVIWFTDTKANHVPASSGAKPMVEVRRDPEPAHAGPDDQGLSP